MPPNLLPSYDLVVLSQASSPAWIDFAAPALGAAVGAVLAGYLGYLASIRAGNRMVRQAKLEECILLLDEVEVFKREKIALLGDDLRRPTTESAMHSVKDIDADAFVRLCERLHILIKLHSRDLWKDADKLVSTSRMFRDLVDHIGARGTPQRNPDEVKSLKEVAEAIGREIYARSTKMRSHIEKEATTEKRSKN